MSLKSNNVRFLTCRAIVTLVVPSILQIKNHSALHSNKGISRGGTKRKPVFNLCTYVRSSVTHRL